MVSSVDLRTVPVLHHVLSVHRTVSGPELLTEQNLTEDNLQCKVLGNIRRAFMSLVYEISCLISVLISLTH